MIAFIFWVLNLNVFPDLPHSSCASKLNQNAVFKDLLLDFSSIDKILLGSIMIFVKHFGVRGKSTRVAVSSTPRTLHLMSYI